MTTKFKINLSELYISGTSSPLKSPAYKSASNGFSHSRKLSATPDKMHSTQNQSKWYMKGSKFRTIYICRQPRATPQLQLAGVTHSSLAGTVRNTSALVRKSGSVRQKGKNFSMDLRKLPKASILNKKNSSKNLQVDLEELSTWLNY